MSDASEGHDVSDGPVGSRRTGSPWLRELYESFAPVREEILARGTSEEEVNDDIDAAVTEVRAERRARGKSTPD